MTPDEIKALTDKAVVDAVNAERARISELEAFLAPETLEIVAEAKKGGKRASDIAGACFAAVNARKFEEKAQVDSKGAEYLAKVAKGAAAAVVVNSGEDLQKADKALEDSKSKDVLDDRLLAIMAQAQGSLSIKGKQQAGVN